MDDLKLSNLKIDDSSTLASTQPEIHTSNLYTQNTKKKYATILVHHLSNEYSDDWQYIFVNYELNKDILNKLNSQIEDIKDFDISVPENDDYLAIVLLDIKNLVSKNTAIEFSSIDLASDEYFNRIFDGKIKPINIHFKSNYNSRKKIRKISRILGSNKLINYLTKEYIIRKDSSSEEESTSSSE